MPGIELWFIGRPARSSVTYRLRCPNPRLYNVVSNWIILIIRLLLIFDFIYGCTSIFGQRRFANCWQFSATTSCREYLHHGVIIPCLPLDRSSLAVLAPPAIGMYRFLTRRVPLIYCDRLFSQYKESHLSEASCLTGSNELDRAKITLIRMTLLIALGHLMFRQRNLLWSSFRFHLVFFFNNGV